MRTILITLCLLFSAFFTYSQNWYPVLPGKTQFFIQKPDDSPDSTLHGFRTTFASVSGTDSLFTFNRIYRHPFFTDYQLTCQGDTVRGNYQFDINRENIGGDGIIVSPNGVFRFYGPPADTFTIQTQLPVGAKWQFQSGTTDSAFIASRGIQGFLGTTDSVMVIEISNGNTVLLSKNHGFLEWNYFYPLASKSQYSTYDWGSLYGIEETQFGRKFPRFDDIFTLDPGDQFRFSGEKCNYVTCTDIKTYIRVNSGGIVGGTGQYNTELSRLSITPIPYFGIDTQYTPLSGASLTFPPDPIFDLLPLEGDTFWVMQNPKVMANWNNRVAITKEYKGAIDSCGLFYSIFEYTLTRTYADGLARVGFEETDFGYSDRERLTCYNKVSEIWNSPCDTLQNPIAVDEALLSTLRIEIFPQPAGENCVIRAKQGNLPTGNLGIYNLNGAEIRQYPLSGQSEVHLETNTLSAGMYFLRMETSQGRRMTGKIVVQH